MWSAGVGKRQLARDVGVQLQQQVSGGGLTSVQVPGRVRRGEYDPELFRLALWASEDKRRLAVGERGSRCEV